MAIWREHKTLPKPYGTSGWTALTTAASVAWAGAMAWLLVAWCRTGSSWAALTAGYMMVRSPRWYLLILPAVLADLGGVRCLPPLIDWT